MCPASVSLVWLYVYSGSTLIFVVLKLLVSVDIPLTLLAPVKLISVVLGSLQLPPDVVVGPVAVLAPVAVSIVIVFATGSGLILTSTPKAFPTLKIMCFSLPLFSIRRFCAVLFAISFKISLWPTFSVGRKLPLLSCTDCILFKYFIY